MGDVAALADISIVDYVLADMILTPGLLFILKHLDEAILHHL